MEDFKFVINENNKNGRIDQFLVYALNERFSRSFIQRLIKEGLVSVNEKLVKVHYKVRLKDRVVVRIPAARQLDVKPEDIPLDIIYEDKELLVVNKPAGLVVHPAAGNYSGTLVNALLHHCKSLSGINGILRPGIVHRLDKYTSGLMVVAKTDLAHRSLAKQFKNHMVKKEYIAFVKGNIEFEENQIDMPIGRHPSRREMVATTFTKGYRAAITNYKVLNRFKDFTVVRLSPKTGRTHQLRVHMAYIGHPILSDKVYGTKDKFQRQACLPTRQALHAQTLGFTHPVTGKTMEFSVGLPKDMQDLLQKYARN